MTTSTQRTLSAFSRRARVVLLAGCAAVLAPGLTLAAPTSGPAAPPAVATAGPRVFALTVGVSDYAGQANDLPYTAQDAVQIGAALRETGVLAPQSQVITEQAATVAAVRAAFARIAAQAGPNDVFLFFFSGHGTQEDTRVSNLEPDGRLENIVLRDGNITDAELGRMMDDVRAGTTIIAIDACFAGGFARNVVDRPGVMGLFSSEEDLTSVVASNFRAGGYLSYYLRSGLMGDADGDGDGTITAGELSTYLHQQFAQNVQNVAAETTDGQQNYQRLVIDRGAVQINAPLLTLAANRTTRGGRTDGGGGKPPEGDLATNGDGYDEQLAGPTDDQQDWGAETRDDGGWDQSDGPAGDKRR